MNEFKERLKVLIERFLTDVVEASARQVAKAEAEVLALRKLNKQLAERIAAQSELLTKRAEK